MNKAIEAMVIEDARVDLRSHEVLLGTETRRLSSQEAAILSAFASRGEDTTLTRLDIYREAWGYTREPQGRALDYAMRRLREKLGAKNPTGSTLGTVRGVGYRLRWSRPAASDPSPAVAPPVAPLASSLPTLPTLLGRATLVAEGLQRIKQAGSLVNLLGPGGIGKSSVATAIAHGIVDGERVWVDLEAAAVGAAEQAITSALFPIGESNDPLLERMQHLLAVRAQPVTIILDGAERHLEELSAVLAPLHFPRLRILVTSRERLLLQREVILQVPPLSIEAAGALIRNVAERRGVRELSDEAGIQALLKQLDGLPLAVELAGARLRSRSADDLARAIAAGRPLRTRERDRARRHASMEAVVCASLDRLETPLQDAIHALSVFQGLFTVEAAAWALDVDIYEAEDFIDVLVDCSMLNFEEQNGSALYRILRPTHAVIRRLRGTPTAAQDSLIQHFDGIGHTDPMRSLGRERGALMRTLRPYAADLAALSAARQPLPDGFAFLCLVVFDALGLKSARDAVAKTAFEHTTADTPFRRQVRAFACRNHHETTDLEEVLTGIGDASTPENRLTRLVCMRRHVTGSQSTEAFARQLLERATAANDHFVVGQTCLILGSILIEQNSLEEAEQIIQRHLEAARAAEDLDNQISAWSSLARVAYTRGHPEEATRRLQKSRQLAGLRHRYAGILLSNLGLVHLSAGEMTEAEEATRSGLDLARRDGLILQAILSLGSLAGICHEKNDLAEFERCATEATELALTNLHEQSRAERIWGYMAIIECARQNFHAAQGHRQRWMDHFGPTRSQLSQRLLAPIEAWILAGLGQREAAQALLDNPQPLPKVWTAERLWLQTEAAIELEAFSLAREGIASLEAMIDETPAARQFRRRLQRTRARLDRVQTHGSEAPA